MYVEKCQYDEVFLQVDKITSSAEKSEGAAEDWDESHDHQAAVGQGHPLGCGGHLACAVGRRLRHIVQDGCLDSFLDSTVRHRRLSSVTLSSVSGTTSLPSPSSSISTTVLLYNEEGLIGEIFNDDRSVKGVSPTVQTTTCHPGNNGLREHKLN
ncbi:hypothetical protein Hamer_G007609 [Homarus americanus]|uniref:Uncharacterized protein n=1 Tax=Homarus americanus TaxID=6706 RepID=A0A8J5MRF3_HOMAM|nr:hypothetical protein Hamer_G007609 [Homarus americanus]